MADVHVDDRDLRIVLDALNAFLEDEDVDLMPAERQAYERLCKAIGVEPIEPLPAQQSLGFLADDEPPHPDEPRPSGRGVMADYIERTRHYLSGGGMPRAEPEPDVAKQIAAKMARASHDAARGVAPAPKPTEPKRALTDEERRALREALGDE